MILKGFATIMSGPLTSLVVGGLEPCGITAIVFFPDDLTMGFAIGSRQIGGPAIGSRQIDEKKEPPLKKH